MDQNLQQRIDEAKKNGYTEEEIQQILATLEKPVETQVPIDRTEEFTGLAEGIGLDTAKKVGIGLGAYYGGKALIGAAGRAMGRGVPGPSGPMGPVGPIGPPGPPAPISPGPVDELTEWYNRGVREKGLTPHTQTPTTQPPTTQPPTTQPPTSTTQVTRPAPGPVKPVETPQQSMIDRAGQMVRQLAANKAVQNMAKMGGVASLSLYSPDTGPMVPSTGRMRGMEINPMTRRPWTQQEISQYENNPMAFDSMLGPVQARR